MQKRILALFLACVLIAAVFAGCTAPQPEAVPSAPVGIVDTPSAAPQAPAVTTATFQDDAKREVELPATIAKISPSGPMALMFLYALAPDLLVSIPSKFTPQAQPFISEQVQGLPVIGQFYGTENLNLEEIAAIGPDIVIDIGEPKKTIAEDMDSITQTTAIPAVHITATTQSTGDAFRTLGKLLGREDKAEVLASYCEKTYADTLAIIDQVGDQKTPVLYLLGDAGLNVIASGSFHAEAVNLVANNVAVVDDPSSKGTGNETDLEQILLWDPDVILFGPNSVYGKVADDPAWQQLKAIQNHTYYEIPASPYNWMGMPPSINRYLGLLWTTKLLYPQYAAFDLYEKVAQYYDLFYHIDLTKEQYHELTKNSLPAA